MSIFSTDTTVSCIEIEPQQTAQKSVIWLHGLGADGSDFVPIVPELKLPASMNIRFIFPHAPTIPVTINNGYEMRAWYDILGLNRESQVDIRGINQSVAIIEKLIKKETARGIPSQHIVLAGFSQGAVMALSTGLRFNERLGGILALSGYLPLAEQTLTDANIANRQTPIFIAHGTEDMVVPHAYGKAAYMALKQANYPVSWHSYAMPHSVCAEEILDISKWLTDIFRDNLK